MTGDEYISFARRLISAHRGQPPAMRTVASRAYYGAFNLAKSLVEMSGQICEGAGNEHLKLQYDLIHCGLPTAQDIGNLLKDLHELRKQADYDLHIPAFETEDFAADAIVLADNIQTRIREFDSEESRNQLGAGIHRYRNPRD